MSEQPSKAARLAAQEIVLRGLFKDRSEVGFTRGGVIRVIDEAFADEREAADALADAAERHDRMGTTRSRAAFHQALDAYRAAREASE